MPQSHIRQKWVRKKGGVTVSFVEIPFSDAVLQEHGRKVRVKSKRRAERSEQTREVGGKKVKEKNTEIRSGEGRKRVKGNTVVGVKKLREDGEGGAGRGE